MPVLWIDYEVIINRSHVIYQPLRPELFLFMSVQVAVDREWKGPKWQAVGNVLQT